MRPYNIGLRGLFVYGRRIGRGGHRPRRSEVAGIRRAPSWLLPTSRRITRRLHKHLAKPMNTPTLPPCDYQPKPYTGPSADEVLALRKQFLNPGIFLYYKKPHHDRRRQDAVSSGTRRASATSTASAAS